MVGFGFKQAWLAVRDAAPEAVVGALGAKPSARCPGAWDSIARTHLMT